MVTKICSSLRYKDFIKIGALWNASLTGRPGPACPLLLVLLLVLRPVLLLRSVCSYLRVDVCWYRSVCIPSASTQHYLQNIKASASTRRMTITGTIGYCR